MKISHIEHLGIAVKSIEEALPYPTQEKHEIDYTSYVNPFIGTDFTGNTYPGAQAPFGMGQLSPDNGLPGWDLSLIHICQP